MEETNFKADMSYMYKTKEEAEKAADALGLKGTHTHKGEDGSTLYMPGDSHAAFMKARGEAKDGHKKKSRYQAARDAMYKKLLKDRYKYSSEASKDAEDTEVTEEVTTEVETEAVEPRRNPYAAGFDVADVNIGRLFEEVL